VRASASSWLLAAAFALWPCVGQAQIDCDQYPVGSGRRDACVQDAARRADEDIQNAYERRRREAIDLERRDERQLRRDREEADPDADRDDGGDK